MLSAREEYSKYYGDFRGVDFSNDHTQVIDQRLAYSVNVYKDYQSGTAGGLETIPGFRKVFEYGSGEIYGIHKYETDTKHILVHVGNKLFLWDNYPRPVYVQQEISLTLPESTSTNNAGVRVYELKIPWENHSIYSSSAYTMEGKKLSSTFDSDSGYIYIHSNEINEGDVISFRYYEELKNSAGLYDTMNSHKSESFMFNNKLYIIDGQNYLCYDGKTVKSALENAYIPTTFKNIIPTGDNADTGLEYEERNLLQPQFKNTFYADGVNKDFVISEKGADLVEVRMYGEEQTIETHFKYDSTTGTITFNTAPPAPSKKVNENNYKEGYPENYSGIEITASKAYDSSAITKCTIFAIFDDRVFLSGNPDNPNTIYFCGRSNVTGFTDPTYFPATNFQRDGVGSAGITGLIPVADTLMALKSDSVQDGAIYFHSEQATGEDLHPKNYPSVRGLAGIGCVGACINFLDDPVFVSRLGVEGVGQLSVRLERAIEHRSSLIDGKLLNLGEDALKNAVLEEWNGYLLLLVDVKIFMADSRQRYTHDTGVMQYEWYYLEDIGVYTSTAVEFIYATDIPEELKGKTVNNREIVISETPGEKATSVYIGYIDDTEDTIFFTIEQGKACLCYPTGAQIGGDFHKAVMLKVIDGNIFFGTENSTICSFNFDMRNEDGEFPTKAYSFDGRTIFSGIATKMDSCSIPHLTKNTVKKSTVIKTKSTASSTLKVKVRTNKKPYEQLARINTSRFVFDDVDFADFSFNIENDTIFAIKEKEKHWVEKQYFLYSDEYCKPLSLFYLAYRYNVSGRIK